MAFQKWSIWGCIEGLSISSWYFLLLTLWITVVLYCCIIENLKGLWEDKVANLWCTLNTLIKLRSLFDIQTLARIRYHLCYFLPFERMMYPEWCSILTTLLFALPSCIHLLRNPSKQKLIYTLALCALSFFMFSFQVHEKSILLPMLPITLLSQSDPGIVLYFTNIAMYRYATSLV